MRPFSGWELDSIKVGSAIKPSPELSVGAPPPPSITSDEGDPGEKTWRRGDDPQSPGAQSEFASYRRHLNQIGVLATFRELEKARPYTSAYQIGLAWTLTAVGALLVCCVSPLFIPFALLLHGTAQRSLNNVLHDSAHGNVVARPSRFLKWLLSAPIFADFDLYRRVHLAHHAHLGDPKRDPDLVIVPPDTSPLRKWSRLAFSPRVIVNSLLGDILKLPLRQAMTSLLFVVIASAALFVLLPWKTAAIVVALWFGARLTVFHAIHCFTELSDHVGLDRGTIIGFTRNSPRTLLSLIFHPHNDNYHLVHHLAPRVPLANLGHAHQILLSYEPYRAGHHCDGYFFGRSPVVRGWVREGRS